MQKMYITSDELDWLNNLASGSQGLRNVQPANAVDILRHLRVLNAQLQRRRAQAREARKTAPSYGKKYGKK